MTLRSYIARSFFAIIVTGTDFEKLALAYQITTVVQI
ncbi:hypothetical protein AMBR_CKHPCMOK_01071 [Lacticaseibacillus rhamnosus]|uniref:Uncharacterized protein n=1 Tax=Lacticaseibacillus rhamnosus TaxID=47715 RepID=A0A6N2XZK1_LACRH|nr:hypothetical protein AMBR_EADFOONE_01780 [Lacticaseibacillus rhamnosus]VTU58134.1 hypothetical protein AMBR_CKHPCMOK_01071 [Lacticaseibacillus rhamnosus]VTU63598.1 hypothetical protein AMBR_NBBOBCOC_01034 [Lacticaseibacillus rhamnosus]VTU68007.1 hypothetical protein AMBR_BLFENHAL_01985 [Lacticaseibacillus rhamnosus]